MARGAAVWRPVVKLPGFDTRPVRTHAKMVGVFGAEYVWQA